MRHSDTHKISSSRMLKKSLMSSALAAGIASATVMGTQVAWAQTEAPTSQDTHAQQPAGGQGSHSKGFPACAAHSPKKQQVASTLKSDSSKQSSSSNETRAQQPQPHTTPSPMPQQQIDENTTYIAENNRVLKTLIYLSQKEQGACTVSDDLLHLPPNWKFSVADARKVTKLVMPSETQSGELNTYGAELGDTSDLKYFTNLKTFDLENYAISKPEELLQNLPDTLEHFTCKTTYNDNFNPSWVAGISRLKHLSSLNVSGTNITDANYFKNLTQLTELDLSSNDISDLTPLAQLTKLQKLNVSSNQISDIKALGTLSQLQNLDISKNAISDISPLAHLTGLKSLNLASNQLKGIATLSSLSQLEDLDISSTHISDISVLSQVTSLKKLSMSHNKITDVSGLAALCAPDHLTIIQADNNAISDVSRILSAVKTNFTSDYPNYSYDFTQQKLEFHKVTGAPTLESFGIRAGDQGFKLTKGGDQTVTSIDLDSYTNKEQLDLTSKDNISDGHKYLPLPGIKPDEWHFDFSVSATFYRYKPYLSDSTPIEVDFGGPLPQDEVFFNKVAVEGSDAFPKDGRIYKVFQPRRIYEGNFDTLSGRNTTRRINILYQKKKAQSDEYETRSRDWIDVPVHVKSMAETWKPTVSELTLKVGEELNATQLEGAVHDTTSLRHYIPKTSESNYAQYGPQQIYTKSSDSGDIEEVVCAPATYTWENFTPRVLRAEEAKTTLTVPFVMTFADGSETKGFVTVHVTPSVTPGGGSGSQPGSDTQPGSGSQPGTQPGSEHNTDTTPGGSEPHNNSDTQPGTSDHSTPGNTETPGTQNESDTEHHPGDVPGSKPENIPNFGTPTMTGDWGIHDNSHTSAHTDTISDDEAHTPHTPAEHHRSNESDDTNGEVENEHEHAADKQLSDEDAESDEYSARANRKRKKHLRRVNAQQSADALASAAHEAGAHAESSAANSSDTAEKSASSADSAGSTTANAASTKDQTSHDASSDRSDTFAHGSSNPFAACAQAVQELLQKHPFESFVCALVVAGGAWTLFKAYKRKTRATKKAK